MSDLYYNIMQILADYENWVDNNYLIFWIICSAIFILPAINTYKILTKEKSFNKTEIIAGYVVVILTPPVGGLLLVTMFKGILHIVLIIILFIIGFIFYKILKYLKKRINIKIEIEIKKNEKE